MNRSTLCATIAAGVLLGACVAGGVAALVPGVWRPQPVLAVSSLSDDSFAVCTVPLDNGVEGFFLLDFQTGDITGGVLNPATQKFGVGYRHNVLKDLNFKAGKAKSARFLLVSGALGFAGQTGNTLAPSVLYVTDASTGLTVAYGIPWGPGAGGLRNPLVALDGINARGGGEKVP